MRYGYARVSTREQNLTAQIEALEKNGCEKIFKEKQTGKKKDIREQLNLMLEQLQEGDTLVITKIDRIARNLRDGLNIIHEMRDKGIAIHVLNMGLIDNTPVGNLILSVLLAIAQFEVDLAKERQEEGYHIARKEGRHLGRPRKYTTKNPSLMHALDLYKEGNKTIRQICDITNVSKATLYRAIHSLEVVRND